MSSILLKVKDQFKKQLICLVLSFHMTQNRIKTEIMVQIIKFSVKCIWFFLFLFVIFFLILRSNYWVSHEWDGCEHGYFYLQGMSNCHPWLNCSDIDFIEIKDLIAVGAVKAVYRAEWKNMNVTYSKLNNPLYADDFHHGLKMLKIYTGNPNIIQLVGFCEMKNIILTEYHSLGNAVNISKFLQKQVDNEYLARVKLCLNYALILELLHYGPAGMRVMCDSNDLVKLLSQLLLTDDMRLVLNDLDALPEVRKEHNISIKCGHVALYGDFVAPEQRWVSHKSFDDDEIAGYDEKTDIWKAASVCDHFLGSEPGSEILRYKLFYIHKKCKNVNPSERPTATQLAAAYIKTMYELKQEL